ncbi:MAG: hypothetical protein AAFW69_09670 [Pseudomonadota bacterium]
MASRTDDEASLWDRIIAAEHAFSVRERQVWEILRIDPVRWSLDEGFRRTGEAWCVAILGRYVVWYDVYEDSFEVSEWRALGAIGAGNGLGEGGTLPAAMRTLISVFETAARPSDYLGAPPGPAGT